MSAVTDVGAPANPNGCYVQHQCFWGNRHLMGSQLSPVLLESEQSALDCGQRRGGVCWLWC